MIGGMIWGVLLLLAAVALTVSVGRDLDRQHAAKALMLKQRAEREAIMQGRDTASLETHAEAWTAIVDRGETPHWTEDGWQPLDEEK